MQRKCFKPASFSMTKENQSDAEQRRQQKGQGAFESRAGKYRRADYLLGMTPS
jgi:hypothetical protein